MKKTLILFCALTLLSTYAFAAFEKRKLEIINSDPNLNKVTVFNATTNQILFVCGGSTANLTTCSGLISSGTPIKLLAQAFNGTPSFIFEGFRNNVGSTSACGTQGVCNFTITQDSTTTAKFHKVVSVRVTVGTGSGVMRVKDTRSGQLLFECPNHAPGCNAGVRVDTHLTIEAIAGPGQQLQKFSGQSGSAVSCTGAGANFKCGFVVKEISSVTGDFIPIP
jgi:hypothetical protein